MNANPAPEMINLTIDGKPISVPKGTNLIEAAKLLGIEVPFYCYHPHLSIAGNCRMCQVQVKGAPKLDIACNTQVREGMEVSTHFTSKAVDDAQAATLEFILINHPLDCTVCDQAGHCKLQDYHYDYNARPSRFLESKEHKVKAEPLGPNVILDGERCIMCTRCIRFCDEITETSELGMLNRGDRSVIAINKNKPLDNALSGTVVDLCPVGALTHRPWRFNTRIWFTKQSNSICPGCSTGCNVKVAERDGQIVQVKARSNDAVNKEWLCDEGRYGFERFLPTNRITGALVSEKAVSLESGIAEAKKIISAPTLVFVSPDLLLEEYALIAAFVSSSLKNARIAVAYRERTLNRVEAILVSPDYASNFRGAEFAGLVGGNIEESYNSALQELRKDVYKNVLVIGDRAILKEDLNNETVLHIQKADFSLGFLTDADGDLARSVKVALGTRSILEKSGLLVNRCSRLQYTSGVVDYPDNTMPDGRLLAKLAQELGSKLSVAGSDRELTLEYLSKQPKLADLTIAKIKNGGVSLPEYLQVMSGQKPAEEEARA